jgi:hypothetical protein
MKKEQIGKLQIILGIFVLIIVITGLIIAFNWDKEQKRTNQKIQEDFYANFQNLQEKNLSNETAMLTAMSFIDRLERSNYNFENRMTQIILFSIIMFILSLIFITEGLSNISKSK